MRKYSSILTSKGQTTIPIQVRNYLNLHIGDEIEFELAGNDSTGKTVVIKNVTLFRNIRELLREVLVKAKKYSNIGKGKRKGECEKEIIALSDLFDFTDDPQWTKYRIEFSDYLNSLNFETVKIIQTIMYLGRDEDYNQDDSTVDIYRKQREYFDSIGWDTQEIEVSQILSKGPSLYAYLLNGFRILKIDI